MKVVVLRRAYGSNVSGEVCGFDEATAAMLLRRGWAVAFEPARAAEEAPQVDKIMTAPVVAKAPRRRG